MQQVGTKDSRRIRFQAIHPVIPAIFWQVIANKYGQIIFQHIHIYYKDTNKNPIVSFQTIAVLFQIMLSV